MEPDDLCVVIGSQSRGSAVAAELECGELMVVETTADGVAAIDDGTEPRCIVTDHNPPAVDCFELLDVVDDIPVVVAATDGSSRLATRALRAGAATYLDPTTLDEATAAIAAAVEQFATESTDRQGVDKRIDEFSSIVSHELRNPIQKALSGVALAKSQCETTYLDEVESTLLQLNDLVENLLDTLEDDSTVELEAVELATAVETAWPTTSRGRLAVESELPRIEAEPSRLYQLLENLFRNCLDHGGEDVTVRVGTVADSPADTDGQLSLYVADDGPGIDPKHRAHVFEYGYTNSTDGTGLGLAIVAEIADTFGWGVTITDSTAGGTRVEISQINIV